MDRVIKLPKAVETTDVEPGAYKFGIIDVERVHSRNGNVLEKFSLYAHEGPSAGCTIAKTFPTIGFGSKYLVDFINKLIPSYSENEISYDELIGKIFSAKVTKRLGKDGATCFYDIEPTSKLSNAEPDLEQ